jgi:carbon storage regulator
MLVLSRKRSERILIGSDICITVVKLEGNQVRLGIDAPSALPVMRAELLERFAAAEQGNGTPDQGPLRVRVRPKG